MVKGGGFTRNDDVVGTQGIQKRVITDKIMMYKITVPQGVMVHKGALNTMKNLFLYTKTTRSVVNSIL